MNETLTILDLNGNLINLIPSDLLQCLQILENLGVAQNDLTSFPAVILISLNTLRLRYNTITELPRLIVITPNMDYFSVTD